MEDIEQYLSFQVGAQWYGVAIENVVEVSYLTMFNELASEESSVLGLMTMRDDAIPVIDLRLRFGQRGGTFQLNTPIISVRTTKGVVGLVVDDVDNVETILLDQKMDYKGTEFRHVQKVAKQDGRLLLLVDPNLI